MFEISLHEKLESRTTNFTRNLCISSSGVGTGEFLASAQSTCIIKTGFWGFLVVAVSNMGVNTWPKAFENPFRKAAPGALRTPVKVPVATCVPGCSEYWPLGAWGPRRQFTELPVPEICFLPAPDCGGPSHIFSKDVFQQEASDPPPILPSGQRCTEPSFDGSLLRPHREPEAGIWFASSVAAGGREGAPFQF